MISLSILIAGVALCTAALFVRGRILRTQPPGGKLAMVYRVLQITGALSIFIGTLLLLVYA